MDNHIGYIYILTNPSFPNYVKIGYANDVEGRVATMNSSECTPFAFRIYATYEVSDRLKDIPVHQLIDQLNPSLRSVDNVDGKTRIREFYAMSPEDAYNLLEKIAKINGLESKLKLWKKTKDQKDDEEVAEKIDALSRNRHHFLDVDFSSSITGHKYFGTTSDDGKLKIIDLNLDKEVPNNANPSKRAIVGQAIADIGGEVSEDETLYQRYHKLTKMVLGQQND